MPDFLLEMAKAPGLEQDSPTIRKGEEKDQLHNLYTVADEALQEMHLRNIAAKNAAMMHSRAAQSLMQATEKINSMPTPFGGPSSVAASPSMSMPSDVALPDHAQEPDNNDGTYDDGTGLSPPHSSYMPSDTEMNGLTPAEPIPNVEVPTPESPGWKVPEGTIANNEDPQAAVAEIAQATGMNPQKIAALALLGQQISKIEGGRAQSAPNMGGLPTPLAGM